MGELGRYGPQLPHDEAAQEDVPKALRILADHEYVHTRYYYGSERQTDLRVS